MIVLAYLGPFAVIPLLVAKDDLEVQWHAKHGLVLLGAEILLAIALGFLSAMMAAVGCGVGFMVSSLLPLAILVLHVICIVKGLNGQRFFIPHLSPYADRF